MKLPQTTIYSEKFKNDLLTVQSIIASQPAYNTDDLSAKVNQVIDIQVNLIKGGWIEPNFKLISLFDFALEIQLQNNQKNSNNKRILQTDYIQQTKENTLILAEALIKSSTAEKNVVYNSKYFSIQLSSSSSNQKTTATQQALDNGVSVIDLSDCENSLRKRKIISDSQTLYYLKIDWNPQLQTTKTVTSTPIAQAVSVTFELITNDGKSIDSRYCNDILTTIQIPLSYTSDLDFSNFQTFNKLGYNFFDPKDPLYNDRCIAFKKTDLSHSIIGRRSLWPNISILCSNGCKLTGITNNKITNNTGYMICSCPTSMSTEVGSLIAKTSLAELSSVNVEIAKCYKTTFIYVIYFFNICRISS